MAKKVSKDKPFIGTTRESIRAQVKVWYRALSQTIERCGRIEERLEKIEKELQPEHLLPRNQDVAIVAHMRIIEGLEKQIRRLEKKRKK